MKLENEFTVPAPVDRAWEVLLDVERVAPCLPGAAVESSDGDAHVGTMAVKLGPITARYRGTVRVVEADEAGRRAVIRAQASDQRGQGTAAATITSTMESVPGGTRVRVATEMQVTGPAAQFGRGVMQDVSAKLMRRFAACLAEEIAHAPAGVGGDADGAPVDTIRATADAGHPRADAGHTRADAGHTRADAGHPRADAGHTRADAGHTRGDTGHTRGDTGQTRGDAGQTRADAGHPRADAGQARADAGHTRGDAGQARADAGHTRADAGHTRADAGAALAAPVPSGSAGVLLPPGPAAAAAEAAARGRVEAGGPPSRSPAAPAAADDVASPSRSPAAADDVASPRRARPTEAVLDLGEASREAVLKRALPLVAALAAAGVAIGALRRGARRS